MALSMIAMDSFHFLRPLWLLVVPVWIIFSVWFFSNQRHRRNAWHKICTPELLRYLLRGEDGENVLSSSDKKWQVLIFIVGALLFLALAGPVWKQLTQPVYKAQLGRVLVLDLSQSMNAEDLRPSRLVRAKQKVQDILQGDPEGQTGLVVFAGSAFDVIPLTTDYRAILALLTSLDATMMPVQGSKASIGIERASAMLKRGAISNGTVILISDGVDEEAIRSAAALAEHGHRLHVLGVGTPQGAPIPVKSKDGVRFLQDEQGNIVIPAVNDDRLKAVAHAGHGSYQSLRADDLDIKSFIKSELKAKHPEAKTQEQAALQTQQWQEEGPWLLLIALPFLMLLFRRGLMVVMLGGTLTVLSMMPQPVYALDWTEEESKYWENNWRDWWLTADQQGQRYMNNKRPELAAQMFEDQRWKAVALYRNGDYEAASRLFAGIDGSVALYDRANALAKAGNLQAALQAYDAVLERDPQHEDARFNRELVEKLMDSSKHPSEDASGKESTSAKKSTEDSQGQGGSRSEQSSTQSQEQGGDEASNAEQNPDSQSKNTRSSDEAKSPTSAASSEENPTDDNVRKEALKRYKEALQKNKDKKEHADEMDEHNKGEKKDHQVISDPSEIPPDFMDTAALERMQAQKQWLRRIPDDPGGLLRRKFLYQYQQQALDKGQGRQAGQAW